MSPFATIVIILAVFVAVIVIAAVAGRRSDRGAAPEKPPELIRWDRRDPDVGAASAAPQPPADAGEPPAEAPAPKILLRGDLARAAIWRQQHTTELQREAASAADSWVCPQCETMTPNSERGCPVCGLAKPF